MGYGNDGMGYASIPQAGEEAGQTYPHPFP